MRSASSCAPSTSCTGSDISLRHVSLVQELIKATRAICSELSALDELRHSRTKCDGASRCCSTSAYRRQWRRLHGNKYPPPPAPYLLRRRQVARRRRRVAQQLVAALPQRLLQHKWDSSAALRLNGPAGHCFPRLMPLCKRGAKCFLAQFPINIQI